MPRKFLTQLLLALAVFLSVTPAHAYWGLPYFGGYGYGWPMRSYAAVPWSYGYSGYGYGRYGYGGYGGYGGGWGTYLPIYLGTTLLSTAVSYGVAHHYQKQQEMQTQNYYDDQGRNRVSSYRPTAYVSDQSVHANWAPPQAVQPAVPVSQPAPYFAPPEVVPNQPRTTPMLAEQQTVAAMPPVAPALRRGKSQALAANTSNSPLSTGFIEMVNSKYHGDLAAALKDPDARSWAQAIGLLGSGADTEIEQKKAEVIKNILTDNKMDSSSKVQSVAAVMRHYN